MFPRATVVYTPGLESEARRGARMIPAVSAVPTVAGVVVAAYGLSWLAYRAGQRRPDTESPQGRGGSKIGLDLRMRVNRVD
jgi:hypothetical protein